MASRPNSSDVFVRPLCQATCPTQSTPRQSRWPRCVTPDLAIPSRGLKAADRHGRIPFATGIWLIGSAAVRSYLQFAFGTISVYGPAATPIAALLFFYVTALAVLIGAEINGHRNGRALRPKPDLARTHD